MLQRAAIRFVLRQRPADGEIFTYCDLMVNHKLCINLI
nr:MAG TPA: hypothetical protein [Bacteriophage sp.]